MQPNNKKPKKTIKFSFYWMYAIILIFLIGMYYLDNNSMTKEVSFNEFEQYVQNGGIKKIIIYENKGIATGAVTDSLGEALFGKNYSKDVEALIETEVSRNFDQIVQKWKDEGKYNGIVAPNNDSGWGSILWSIGPILLLKPDVCPPGAPAQKEPWRLTPWLQRRGSTQKRPHF